MQVKITATEPQAAFLNLDCKFPAFVAGFGTGKSEVMCNSALLDSLEGGADSLIALYEPTYDLVRLILAPRMEEKLQEWGVRYKYNKSENIIYTSTGQMGDFVLRTLDNPARIVGYESFRAKIDEIDTLKHEHAAEAWIKIIARNRQKPSTYRPTSNKPINTVSIFSTPEGFKFVHDKWVVNRQPGYEMIQASTMSNPFLPSDYVDSLRASYPGQLIDAYIDGQFVNLTSGTVYYAYDRARCRSNETIKDGEPLFIGQDFNVGKMASTIYVKRSNGWHAVAELCDLFDTPDVIRVLKDRYSAHRIIIYPDASGQSRKSVGASQSDVALFQQAGFEVRVNSRNPAVKDRVLAMNKALEIGQVWVNDRLCPTTARGLEQQAYDKNGEPDKQGGVDHQCFTGSTIVNTLNGAFRFDEIPESGYVDNGFGQFVRYRLAGMIKSKAVVCSVVLSDHSVVECTYDHKFLTSRGEWVCAKNLQGEELASYQTLFRSSKGLGSTSAGSISQTHQSSKDCTGMFGSSTMAKYRMGLRSTTLTRMFLTIKSKISVFSRREIIQVFTHQARRKEKRCLNLVGSIRKERLSGMEAKAALSGTGSTTKKTNTNCISLLKRCVASAGRRLLLSMSAVIWPSAQTTAHQNTEGHQALIMSRECASFVVRNSQSTNTGKPLRVVKVVHKGIEPVYCMTTDCGFFGLNGLIVSNCDATTYPIAYEMPVVKPVLNVPFSFAL